MKQKMTQQDNYFVLNKPPITLWTVSKFIITIPISLPMWIMSFLLTHLFLYIVLNPTRIKKQQSTQLAFLSDDPEEKGTVIVNLSKRRPYKTARDSLLKFNNNLMIMRAPFFPNAHKHELCLDNPKDKNHIDLIISRIGFLTKGESKIAKFKGKTFDWSEIHFKGSEYLDSKLRDYFFQQLQEKHGEAAVKPRKLGLDFFTLKTPEGAILDSVAVSTNDEKNKPMSERKFVVACLVRDQNYMGWLKDFNHSAEQIGCTIIGFNYRGIDYSQGRVWTQENMISDVLAQVSRLLELGAKPENIGLEGQCLGAAIATITAARLHKAGSKVKLYNERSFRSLIHVTAGYFLPAPDSSPYSPFTWIKYLTVGIVYVTVAPLMWSAGWQLDAERAWDKIPLTDKAFSVIRNSHTTDSTTYKTDGIIEDSWASIASLMDAKRADIIARGQQPYTKEESELVFGHTTHHFKVKPDLPERDKNKRPHFLARRQLIQTESDGTSSRTMHQHMIDRFKNRFWRDAPSTTIESIAQYATPLAST